MWLAAQAARAPVVPQLACFRLAFFFQPAFRRRRLSAAAASPGAMNFELIELEPLTCEAYQTKEVLKILLHSIIFQRALNEHKLTCSHRGFKVGLPAGAMCEH